MISVSEQFGTPWQLASILAPLGVYLLILGVFNTRRHPRLLSARVDFLILITALCPLLLLPVLYYVGHSIMAVAGAGAAMAAGILLLAPRKQGWVIYNITPPDARAAVAAALRRADPSADEATDDTFVLSDGGRLLIEPFSPLRNVSIRLQGGSGQIAGRFAAALHGRLRSMSVEPTPVATALLLLAAAMMVVPAALVAQRVPDIVRLLTDLLP